MNPRWFLLFCSLKNKSKTVLNYDLGSIYRDNKEEILQN